MRYQLVLQWPASSVNDYDAVIEIEDLLVENLPEPSEVDGHDAGSSEVNIFVLTDNPQTSFEQIKTILGRQDIWGNARVAYREVGGTKYTILWPQDLAEFTIA